MNKHILATITLLFSACLPLSAQSGPTPINLTTLPELTEIGDTDIIHVYDMSQPSGSRSKKLKILTIKNWTADSLDTVFQPKSAILDSLVNAEPTALALDLLGKATANELLSTLGATTAGIDVLTAANSGAQRTALGLVIGANVQAYNLGLQQISALTTTSFGRGLLEKSSLVVGDISNAGTMALQSANNVAITGGNITGLSSLKLALSLTDTLDVSDNGLGWVDGRLTLQTPVGAMQFYETGSPEEAVIYFPGKLVVGSLETPLVVSTIDASLITSGIVPSSVMQNSIPMPLASFQDMASKAGANGLTYSGTGPLGATEPATPGIYFAAIEVTDGGTDTTNKLEGKIRTGAQMRSDLQTGHLVSVPSTTSSSGAAGDWSYDASYLYICTATNTWKRVAIATW